MKLHGRIFLLAILHLQPMVVLAQTSEFNSPFDYDGKTILETYPAPLGYEVKSYDEDTFPDLLRKLKIKPECTKPLLANGKPSGLRADAIIQWPGEESRQCADTVMGLWAIWQYQIKELDQVTFNIPVAEGAEIPEAATDLIKKVEKEELNDPTSMYKEFHTFPWLAWKNGWYPKLNHSYFISGWYVRKNLETFRPDFLEYLTFVYGWVRSTSLEQSMNLKKVDLTDLTNIQVGDIFIRPPNRSNGVTGHVKIVVNVAINPDEQIPSTDPKKVLVVFADGNMKTIKTSHGKEYIGTEMRIIPGDEGISPWTFFKNPENNKEPKDYFVVYRTPNALKAKLPPVPKFLTLDNLPAAPLPKSIPMPASGKNELKIKPVPFTIPQTTSSQPKRKFIFQNPR